MGYKVIISEQAESDLKSIYSYISDELKSENSAERITLRLHNAMASLTTMPKRFQVYPVEPWQSREVRSVPVGNYNLFYLVKDDDCEVWITRVVYGKRDFKNIL
ncbi:MAG: type II toxin-antitoxin system RelE/ParE family toxin [Fibrobacter sp.]|nr:type II toxin-antitoxin system RelE/ParE family toxin [Fibrobacter sp.]